MNFVKATMRAIMMAEYHPFGSPEATKATIRLSDP